MQQADFTNYFTNLTRGGLPTTLSNPIGRRVHILIADWDLSLDREGAITAAMLISLSEMPNNSQAIHNPNPNVVTYRVREAAAASQGRPAVTAVTLTPTNASHDDFQEASLWFGTLLVAISRAKAWILDLSACYQVRPLNARNISNYFASQNIPSISGKDILEIIQVSSNVIDNIMSNAQLRALVDTSSFVSYHTSAASTPSLIMKVASNLGPNRNMIFSDATMTVVNDAIATPWDVRTTSNIPVRDIAVTHAFLDAIKMLPEGWIQGTKARDAMAPTVYRKFVSMFTRYSALSLDQDAINATNTVAELFAASRDILRHEDNA